MSRCSYCNTTYKEVLQTGFVGCEHCYEEMKNLRVVVKNLYGGKTHKGRGVKGGKHGSI